jgi:hypothetical protein
MKKSNKLLLMENIKAPTFDQRSSFSSSSSSSSSIESPKNNSDSSSLLTESITDS